MSLKTESLDVIVILGGDGENRERSNLALRLAQEEYPEALLVATGSHFGLTQSDPQFVPEISEANATSGYLQEKGFPSQNILVEERSRDWMSAMILVYDLLEHHPLTNCSDSLTLHVIPGGKDRVERAQETAESVFPSTKYQVQIHPTHEKIGFFQKVVEQAVRIAWKIDTRLCGIRPISSVPTNNSPGYRGRLQQYLLAHPMYQGCDPQTITVFQDQLEPPERRAIERRAHSNQLAHATYRLGILGLRTLYQCQKD